MHVLSQEGATELFELFVFQLAESISGSHNIGWRDQNIEIAKLPERQVSVELPGERRPFVSQSLNPEFPQRGEQPDQFCSQSEVAKGNVAGSRSQRREGNASQRDSAGQKRQHS